MARDDAGRRKSESTSDRAGALDVGARVWAKASFDEKRRLGEIVDVRREDGVAVAYYVHYSELNKRLDAWVPVEDVETRKEGEGEGKPTRWRRIADRKIVAKGARHPRHRPASSSSPSRDQLYSLLFIGPLFDSAPRLN